ncbi:MAG: hypothetical protein H6832_19115 [Planctomycetes bacterium]|nr:hypothetical protein [Planctomycetota bacterium]
MSNHVDESFFRYMQEKLATEIGRAIEEQVLEHSRVTQAIQPFVNRMNELLQAVRMLLDQLGVVGITASLPILRSMYDAHIQALYILNDPEKAESRAMEFMEYEWIEQHLDRERMCRFHREIHDQIVSTPEYLAGVQVREKKIAELRDQYRTRAGKREGKDDFRRKWYSGDLARLAEVVGLRREYDYYQNELSSAVHATPKALVGVRPFKTPEQVAYLAWTLYFRVLGGIARFHGVMLNEEQSDQIESVMNDHLALATRVMLEDRGLG